jgi:SAM-dependent methyltransferase
MAVLGEEIASDWYATAFNASNAEMAWTDRTVSEIDRALKILRPRGDERILDLACGSGRHAIELRRRDFSVVGADISEELIEIARGESTVEGFDVEFVLADLRELDYEDEFDFVLNLNDGAIGYLENDEENRRAFEVIARALRPGGRNLVQLPNVLYAREHLPQRSWIPASSMVELVEHRWNKSEKRLEGLMVAAHFGQVLDGLDGIEFTQRLYTAEELREIYAAVGMTMERTFHGNGRPKEPTASQFEVFATAVKD